MFEMVMAWVTVIACGYEDATASIGCVMIL